MPKAKPILVPQENVNDETVRILNWLVPSGQRVDKDQPLVELESSKTNFEIYAPAAGIVQYSAQVGDEIRIGAELCVLHSEEQGTSAAPPGDGVAALPAVAPSAVANPVGNHHQAATFSNRARDLLAEHGLTVEQFAGRGLVRTRDVLEFLGKEEPAPQPLKKTAVAREPAADAGPIPATGVPFRSEELPRAKRMEIKYLASARDNTLPSQVSVLVPTRGLRAAAARQATLAGNVTALVIFEVARLLRKYPFFNAFYANGTVNYYEEFNIGFAIDGDFGLKVPVIRSADHKGLIEIAGEVRELLVGYLEDALPVQALAGGTFTITDLSGEGVHEFSPVLNQGQAAILGLGAESFLLGPDHPGFFSLILGFDHQLAAGRQAARFLNDLRERLQHHEQALQKAVAAGPEGELACSECLRPLDELRRLEAYLLPVVAGAAEQRLVCSICLAGY
jgi:pyruvate/2-oxoglutarate dehydrogenase complex dihydrolipoamide acyltransferase (E2) component